MVAGTAILLASLVIWQLVSLAMSPSATKPANPYPGVELQQTYTVVPGDTVNGLAHRFGVAPASILRANHIANPNLIVVGERLVIPASYHPRRTERLIRRMARRFGIDPNFALAIAYEESGFQQYKTSPTGAIGIMQVEPETGVQLAR
ncbi:MAG TPA: LysM peptidoglycan-binding domain-containing protein, partial [Actinomycetota bacterium]|nr:LysM peptidoglycan-binding domain-containing protein [Actinomycetota bacterium]